MTLGDTCQVMKTMLRVALQLGSGFKKLGVQNKPRWTVTIYLEGLADMAASNWLTSMVENKP